MFVPPKLIIHIQPWETFFGGKIKHQSYKERVAAAIVAAPYIHPKLQSIAISGSDSEPLNVQTDISDALKAIAEMARTRSSSGAYQQT